MELRNDLRRILQIGRQNDGRLATCLAQSADQGLMRTKVARKPQPLQACIAGCQTAEHGQRLIAGMIVDQNPLPVIVDQVLTERRVEQRQIVFFIVGGSDYGKLWHTASATVSICSEVIS